MKPDSPKVSAIVIVGSRTDEFHAIFADYHRALNQFGRSYELIFVMDGEQPAYQEALAGVELKDGDLRVLTLARRFGDSTAIVTGIEAARGDVLLLLPAYSQVCGAELPRILEECINGADVALASRQRDADSRYNRLQSSLFSAMVSRLAGLHLEDAGCEVMAIRREVAQGLKIYGDLHRFIPALAHRQGYRVVEVPVAQPEAARKSRVYPAGVYVRRMLDVLSVFFLIRFTKKPLRFFGLIGLPFVAFGALGTIWLLVERVMGIASLADRPALFMFSLSLVLGIQIIAIGLVGEIVIFAHGKELSEYSIERVLRQVDCKEQDGEVRRPP